jgi:hypothetical protein
MAGVRFALALLRLLVVVWRSQSGRRGACQSRETTGQAFRRPTGPPPPGLISRCACGGRPARVSAVSRAGSARSPRQVPLSHSGFAGQLGRRCPIVIEFACVCVSVCVVLSPTFVVCVRRPSSLILFLRERRHSGLASSSAHINANEASNNCRRRRRLPTAGGSEPRRTLKRTFYCIGPTNCPPGLIIVLRFLASRLLIAAAVGRLSLESGPARVETSGSRFPSMSE